MRSLVLRLSFAFVAAFAFAAVSWGEEQARGYEIKNADRGLVHRVRVLYDGRSVGTMVMSRGRTGTSAYCCTPDSCKEIAVTESCSTFKMTCDKDGACWASGPGARSST